MIEPLSDARTDAVTAPDDLSLLPGLSVSADPGRHACRLKLVGRLDADTVPLFTACMTSWVDRGVRHLVVDLTRVSSVDTVGAAALSRASHVLRRSGGSLHVTAGRQLAGDALTQGGVDFLVANEPDNETTIGAQGDG